MWQQIILALTGLCAGIMTAGGVTGFLIGLSIIPRYAGITHTSEYMLLYEDTALWGTVLGNVFYLYDLSIPLGTPFLLFYGLFSGIFLGGWILALEEIADVFPIFARRAQLTKGFSLVVLCVALGKTAGSLLYYYKGWQ